jgi:putative exosortase-associated protein (TIGR04073 family)
MQRLLLACVVCLTALHFTASAQNPGQKLGRGFANVTLGFVEIPATAAETARNEGPAMGATVGFLKGIGYSVVRTLAGAYELVTFPFPVPANYAPIMHPEYPWDRFEKAKALDAETEAKSRTIK